MADRDRRRSPAWRRVPLALPRRTPAVRLFRTPAGLQSSGHAEHNHRDRRSPRRRPDQDVRHGRRRRPRARRSQRRVRARPLHRGHGTVGVGQVDADALHGRARRADVRSCLHRRRRDRAARRRGADAAAARPHRVRVPVVQPGPDADAGENITLPGDLAGTPVDRAWFDYLVGRLGHRRPPVAPSERAVRRPAAAGRVRAGADRPPRADLRRRADRQPRLQRLRGGARVPAPRRSPSTASRS